MSKSRVSAPVAAPNFAALQTAMQLLLQRNGGEASFPQEWLTILGRSIGALGARLRRLSAEGVLADAVTSGEFFPTTNTEEHERCAALAYSTGRPQILSQPVDALEGTPAARILFSPLVLDGELCGVIELMLSNDSDAVNQRHLAQQIALASGYLAESERRRRKRVLDVRQTLIDEVERFTRSVHEKLDVRHTAYAAANDGRKLIGCDRVTVLLRRGRRYDVTAVSGVDAVECRSQAAKLLGELTEIVAAAGEPIYFDGGSDELSPQLRDALNRYLDETHVRFVGVIPLIPELTGDAETKGDASRVTSRPQPLGAIVVEQIENVTPAEGRKERVELVAQHTTLALAKALEHERIPFLPLWNLCGGMSQFFAPGTRAKTWAVITLVIAAAASLKLIRTDFVLHARGTLQPTQRHHVFAPLDGAVKVIHVRHGQRVAAGQLLVELRNTDLDVSLADVTGQRTAAYEQLLAVERSLYEDGSQIGVEERHRLAGRRSELKQQIVSFDEQLRLLRRKREQLNIHSPIAGEITTWDVEQLLRERPVRQGQILIDVADVTGPWELELQVPEDGIAHLLTAQEERGLALPVHYRLLAEPRTDRTAEVREVHFAAEIRGEEGNTVLTKAALTGDTLPVLRPGAEATAKVYCGERALGYVWLHDAVDFFRTKIWFRMY